MAIAETAKINSSPDIAPTRKFLNKLYRQRYLFMMLAPAVLLVFTFSYLTLGGWVIAFKQYQIGQSMWSADWAGWYHFKSFLLESPDFVRLLENTLSMNVMMLVVNLAAAMIFAILLNEVKSRKFARVVQTLSFFPFFISWVIVYSIMSALMAVSSGAINVSLIKWGLLEQGLNILGDPKFSWWLVVALSLWKSIGYNGVIFIAAIASISSEQYEAADIDGASRFQKIIYITLPNLLPTLIVLLIMNSGWILNSNFDMYYLFSNATNYERMEVLDIYIYNYGIKLTNYSYATAVGIMKSAVSIALLLFVNAMAKRINDKSIM
ncbi:sugar ABC transporter permease [Paenibacillus sp. MWE-103]|uniref:Sugar ABC transporter permease n=1 Tax=Paenibacillus artemisiicola TaxID=1172618 RepID=A0ABS3W5W8_9BACL|nr:ABC transporter permease subunit [Paenibacillus artemisiicola]MBO7743689.1 sugar ABC transporter permease [Paenibacillus artemisiicola]